MLAHHATTEELYNEDQQDRPVSRCHELVVRQSPSSKDVSTEVEEYTLLGAITEQQLLKTEDFMCDAVQ
jgi:hypothetical protein